MAKTSIAPERDQESSLSAIWARSRSRIEVPSNREFHCHLDPKPGERGKIIGSMRLHYSGVPKLLDIIGLESKQLGKHRVRVLTQGGRRITHRQRCLGEGHGYAERTKNTRR